MTLFWALVSWAVMLPVLPIVYSLQKNECRPKKNLIAGVTLPYEAQEDGEVHALLEQYRKELKAVCLGMLAAVIPSLLFKSVGLFLTYYILWAIALAAVFLIPYIRCNRSLQKLKVERGWRQSRETPQVVTDLKAAAEEMRRPSLWWFLPPFLLSLVPLLFDRSIWGIWVLDAALVPVFYLCCRYLYRNRAEVVDEDSGRTLALTRIRRYNWSKCWITLAWATGLFNLGLWLTLEHIWLCMAVILAYGFTGCITVIRIEFRVRRLQEKLTADSGRGYYVDGDDHWIWGMIYYNPNDTRLTVNARVGVGSSLNMARRPAQIIMGLLLAVLLACPLCGVWMLGMERAPVELEITDTELTGSHFGRHWSVALADVAEIEVIETLPRLSRIMGTGMETACTGQFSSSQWGRVTLCIDPRVGPWLLVKQNDGELFLFGASEEGRTAETATKLR